ncbi:MAG: hypothetical protein WKG06_08935 [Segetibacter sp.]
MQRDTAKNTTAVRHPKQHPSHIPTSICAYLNKSNFANYLLKIMFDTFRKYLEDKIALTDQDYELIESRFLI